MTFFIPEGQRDGVLPDPSVYERLFSARRRRVMVRRQRQFFRTFDEASLKAMKYFYFPMHKETDLPLSFQATSWQDQRNTVSLLASCLPPIL